jgi:hypothetical protein
VALLVQRCGELCLLFMTTCSSIVSALMIGVEEKKLMAVYGCGIPVFA